MSRESHAHWVLMPVTAEGAQDARSPDPVMLAEVRRKEFSREPQRRQRRELPSSSRGRSSSPKQKMQQACAAAGLAETLGLVASHLARVAHDVACVNLLHCLNNTALFPKQPLFGCTESDMESTLHLG
jgi:hypothetical protein